MITFDISVDASGPVFDGMAVEEVHRYRDDLIETLGNEAVGRIRAYLPTQYMYLGHNGGDPVHNPIPPNAGALQASVHSDRESPSTMVVTDAVTYGAWIEGVDIMNLVYWKGRVRRGLSPRFPGYHTFRIITQELNVEAEAIAERVLVPYIDLMNA